MKSTFGRLFTSVSVILMTSMLLIGIVFQLLTSRYLTKQVISGLQNDAKVIGSLVTSAHFNQSMSGQDFQMALAVAVSVSGADAVICDGNGRLITCAEKPMGCSHTGMQLDEDYLDRAFAQGGTVDTGIVRGLYTDTRYLVAHPVSHPETGARMALVLVSSPVDTALETMRRITQIFLSVSVLVAVVSVVVMNFFVRKQSSPLRAMAQAATAFGHGNLTARVKTTGRNTQEVEELALAFNNMASSLEKSEAQRQEFVANVSHELKTPMTTISGYVDGILDGTIPPEKSRQYLHLVSDETKRLSRLVRNMLDISRLRDRGSIDEEQKTRFDVEELAGQVLISFEQKINDKSIDVRVDMPDHPVYTRADQDAITQVIYNLVDNAVKFCPQNGELGITVRSGGGKAYIAVSNTGETIPAEELPLVFERFHKTDKSRSVNRESWGLGLYIVKTLLDSHGENISVTSHSGKTTFTFTLPLVL